MIYLRLDERLLHGQVTTTWIGFLGIARIILADDEVAQNEIQCQLLKMSAPKEAKMLILTVEKAANKINDPRCEAMKIIVICANPYNVLKLIESVPAIHDVNLANYGFQANPNGVNKKMLTSNLSVDPQELEVIQKIMAKDLNCYCQVLANQPKKTIVIH